MKKLSLLIVAILTTSLSFSQLIPFTFGPKLGFTASNLTTKIDGVTQIKENMRSGMIGGAFARFSLKKIFIQGEVYVAFKGGQYEYTNIQNNLYSYSTKLTTLDIPILFGYKLIDLPMFNIRVNAGPVMSRILNKDLIIKRDEIEVPNNPEDYKINIWAIQAGIGLDVTKITLDFKYELGINNIGKTLDHQKKSNVFHVTIGYKIL